MLTIGILIFPDAEELDFVGPFEVLSFVNKVRPDSSRVLFVAETADPVRAYNGMRVLPDTTLSACPQLDILVIPGGQGRRQAMKNPAILDFIKENTPIAYASARQGLTRKNGREPTESEILELASNVLASMTEDITDEIDRLRRVFKLHEITLVVAGTFLNGFGPWVIKSAQSAA
mgnify:CR=1 FL=1